jgi:hypothetical protein
LDWKEEGGGEKPPRDQRRKEGREDERWSSFASYQEQKFKVFEANSLTSANERSSLSLSLFCISQSLHRTQSLLLPKLFDRN